MPLANKLDQVLMVNVGKEQVFSHCNVPLNESDPALLKTNNSRQGTTTIQRTFCCKEK